MRFLTILTLLLASMPFIGFSQQPITKFQKDDTGLTMMVNSSTLRIEMISPAIARVMFSPTASFSERPSLAILKQENNFRNWSFSESGDELVISTGRMKIKVKKANSAISYFDGSNALLLSESAAMPRKMTPAVVLDEKTWHAETFFDWKTDEGLYGLGQFQDGIMNYRGHNLTLVQDNTVDINPVLISDKGYGIYFDNYSQMEFRDNPDSTKMTAKGDFRTGSLWCEVADQVDYYFLAGPQLDSVVASYRKLTGHAPLFGKWAYGFWQCKEHYSTQNEILDVVKELRKRRVPLDNIVQDWFYWNPQPWGSHYFDPLRYPDPSALTKELHEKWNTKIMISVWAKFDSASNNYNAMNKAGFLYPTTGVFGRSFYYDAFNPKAREMYWQQMRDSIYKKGFDAWWLDATEPEMGNLTSPDIKRHMNNYLGTGARYLNAYSLMTTEAVYKGQRSESEKQRVFMLTRSTFAGQQRNAAASWSGDINASWKVFRNQIAGGLNLTYTGLPYWTTDVGGFFVSDFAGGCKNKEYQELFTRWYQFGVFCPIFRVHGSTTPREIYQFGEPGYWAYDVQLKFDNLRYRLMPYIYSTAWMVTNNGYTMMRGLNFDFRNDKNVKNIADEYMFGPSFLVAPVTECMYNKDFADVKNQSNPIPAKVFTTPDRKPGLEGTYYNGKNFEQKILTRVDTAIRFNWGTSNPQPGVDYDNFSIEWNGFITAPEDGEYVFITYADDGAKLWVDNKQLVNDWTQHGSIYLMGRIKLQANKKYPVKLKYNEIIGGAAIDLLWITPSQLVENIKIAAQYDPAKTKSRKVYLPQSKGWYDFWTGKFYKGGQSVQKLSPIDIMPLYVKAGSIVPMGPFLQYAAEKPADPIELRIYRGADGNFELYEDENDNYNYEKGSYATITIKWKDSEKTLTIGKREGSFEGMISKRTFKIILVGENKGTGEKLTANPDRTVYYTGNEIKAKF